MEMLLWAVIFMIAAGLLIAATPKYWGLEAIGLGVVVSAMLISGFITFCHILKLIMGLF